MAAKDSHLRSLPPHGDFPPLDAHDEFAALGKKDAHALVEQRLSSAFSVFEAAKRGLRPPTTVRRKKDAHGPPEEKAFSESTVDEGSGRFPRRKRPGVADSAFPSRTQPFDRIDPGVGPPPFPYCGLLPPRTLRESPFSGYPLRGKGVFRRRLRDQRDRAPPPASRVCRNRRDRRESPAAAPWRPLWLFDRSPPRIKLVPPLGHRSNARSRRAEVFLPKRQAISAVPTLGCAQKDTQTSSPWLEKAGRQP